MNKILITGGAGFIGSKLAIRLKDMGYNVTVMDNLSVQIHGDDPENTSATFPIIVDAGISFIKGSVTNIKDWEVAVKGQDAIVHLAAETGTGQSMYEIQKYVDVNISGTSLLLDFLTNNKHSIKKLVVASSRAIYGEGKYLCEKDGNVYPNSRKEQDMSKADFECKCPICGNSVKLLPTDEESKIHPTSIYGITKQVQEQMVIAVGKSIGVPSVAFRYQNVYGPGQSLSNPYTGILSIFSTQIKNGNDINIFEDGKESRDFVYIDDVVDATILGLTDSRADYQVFNVGADLPVDVLTVAETLKKNYNSNVSIKVSGNFRLGDIRHNYGDLTRINEMLGFKPKFLFHEGIRVFCEWVNSQEVKEDKYFISIEEMKSKGLYK